MTKIAVEKCIISIIWSISGIHIPLALTKSIKSNSQDFWQHITPDIQQRICPSSRRKTLKDILAHFGNAAHENPPFSPENIECAKPKEFCIHAMAQTRPSTK
jgi:hypothetical protein